MNFDPKVECVSGKESAMKKIFCGFFLFSSMESNLHAQTPFYQGKTITLVAGTTAEVSMMLTRAS